MIGQKDEKSKINQIKKNICKYFIQNNCMKLSKENFGWIFTSCALAVLLALSIYLGISGWYFKTEASLTTDIELGKTVQFGVKENESSAISFNLDGSFLSGERLPQLISIKNLEDESSLYLRAKIYIYTGDNQTLKMNLVETVNWTYQDDGYYYFNDLLTPMNKVALCSYVFIDESTKLQTNTKYIVTISVEALGENQDVTGIWKYNPIQNV